MASKQWKPQEFDKEKTAVALSYDPSDVAPKIVATGKGHVADKIIASAKENDVPFYKDSKLADTLSKFEIGEAIPPELYEVVAEITVTLSFFTSSISMIWWVMSR